MKKAFLTAAAITAATGFHIVPANAAEVTGNAGLVSNYVFRGADASNGKAAAQGGLDLSAGMFYAGTWLSSVQVANTVDVLDTGGDSV
ncbi:MAG: TorF family putative porin, partial [Gammaproteobacteria bacterium]|nr:TorF family putative porin [Gammaproteobacteria bacterium]